MNDGTPRAFAQGTAVQVHLPADALRVLRPSPRTTPGPAAEEVAPEADPVLELGAG